MANEPEHDGWILRLHRILLALNLAIAGETLVCIYWHSLADRFYRVETLMLVRWDKFQHGGLMRYPDYSSGYVGFWLPVGILVLFFWALSLVSSRTRFTRQTLRSFAGYVALFLVPGLWIFGSLPYPPYSSWVLGLFHRGAPLELGVVAFCAFRYLKGRWPFTASWTVFLVTLHFIYWFYMPGASLYVAGPIPIIVGLCSSLVWGTYLRFLRRDNSLVSG